MIHSRAHKRAHASHSPSHASSTSQAFQEQRVRTVTRFAQLLMLCLVMYLITSLIIYFEAAANVVAATSFSSGIMTSFTLTSPLRTLVGV